MSSSALERHVGRGSFQSWTYLQEGFDRFASPEFEFVRLWKIDLVEVESLKQTAAKIQPLYDEAKVKQFDDGDVKGWLNQLEQLLCDAEDIIDEYAAELLRLKLKSESQLHPDHQIQQGIEKFGSQVRNIDGRLKKIAREGIEQGLTKNNKNMLMIERPAPLAGSSIVSRRLPEYSETNLGGLYSPGFLLDESDLDSDMCKEISYVPPKFVPRLMSLLFRKKKKMSLSGLRDGEFKELGAPSNYALELETIGELVRSASSKVKVQIRELKMPDEPHHPFPLVQTYHETVRSKLGKEQPSSMETKINKGSTSKVVNFSEVCESFRNLQEPLRSCVFYTSTLFPGDYEFEEDTLIQLWIAAGFIQTELEQLVERGQTYFKVLHELSIFQKSSTVRKNYDPTTYRVHKDVCELKQQGFPIEYTTMDEGGTAEIKPTTLHSTLLLGGNGTDFDSKIFERFYKAKNLRTFKVQIEYGSPIKHVPHIFFVKLESLQVLDLSSTEIKELPTSVCNLKHLRYLDVSGTPIKKLPESVCELNDLQTLKLKDCSNLVGLPEGTSKLINLQHLDLDGLYQLTSMPPRMGQLTNLQKLSIFVVGREQGFRIEELKCMKKLRGSLCIAKMENVTEDEASVAELGDKIAIHSLEFKWSSSHSNGETKFNLIQPHCSIKQLKITRYGATSFPNWLSGENFGSLAILHLSYCNCTHLPALGELRSLESLYINQMHSLEKIGHEFYGGELFHGVAFSNLELLEIDGMPCLEEWEAIQKCYMPKLYKLTIIDCPRLVNLPNFISLKSLQQLRIILCPKIQSFPPGERLPESLQSLTITECPKLEEQCQKEDGEGWCKIAGIPEIWIDDEQQPKIIVQAKESESLRGEEEEKGRKEQRERERQELDESRSHGDQGAGTGRPTSSRPKTVDREKVEPEVKEEEKEEKLEGDTALNKPSKLSGLQLIVYRSSSAQEGVAYTRRFHEKKEKLEGVTALNKPSKLSGLPLILFGSSSVREELRRIYDGWSGRKWVQMWKAVLPTAWSSSNKSTK